MAIDAENTITSPIARSSSADQASVASYASIARGLRGCAAVKPISFSMPNGGATGALASPLGMTRHRLVIGAGANLRGEALAALYIVGELIEACAGRRQHHG